MFLPIKPYSQYKTGPSELTIHVKPDRRGTLKATFEIGEQLLHALGWQKGDYISVEIGAGDLEGVVRLSKTREFGHKLQLMRNKRVGWIAVQAAPLEITKMFDRRVYRTAVDQKRALIVRLEEEVR